MKWTQQVNLRVRSTIRYYAFAHDNPSEEDGFVASIYKTYENGQALCSKWGKTKSTALKGAVKTFDPDAKFGHSTKKKR